MSGTHLGEGEMSSNINVLFLAAEADPFVKVGGLGDVSGALPRALRVLGPEVLGDVRLDLRLVLPMHSAVRAESLRPLTVYSLPLYLKYRWKFLKGWNAGVFHFRGTHPVQRVCLFIEG
jgi:hypothetical protein